MNAALRCICVGALATALLLTTSCRRDPDLPRPESEDSWQYEFLPEKTQRAFDLRLRLAADSTARMRVLLGAPDEGDSLCIEFGPQGISAGRAGTAQQLQQEVISPTPLSELAGRFLVIQCRPHRWGLVADGRLLGGGDDPIKPGEGIGLAVRGGDVRVRDLRFQPMPAVHFTDSFMRAPGDAASWTELSGSWALNMKTDPLLSANAFSYTGVGSPAAPKAAGLDPGAAANPRSRDGAQPAGSSSFAAALLRRMDRASRPAASVVGDTFWGDIDISVACRPSGPAAPEAAGSAGGPSGLQAEAGRASRPGAVGLFICYRGPNDYLLFRWSSGNSDAPRKQLIRKSGDTETVLMEATGGYAPDQWYTLHALLGAGWGRFQIDDTPIFTVRDEGFTYGKVGLYVEGETPAVFDDMRVESRPSTLVDFDRYRLGQWLVVGGGRETRSILRSSAAAKDELPAGWAPSRDLGLAAAPGSKPAAPDAARWLQLAADPANPDIWSGGVVVRAPAEARLLWGRPSWRDYSVSASLGAWEEGSLGLCFRYQDDMNYYSARWRKASAPVIELWRTESGQETLLERVPAPTHGGLHRLEVSSDGAEIVVCVDREPLLRTVDAAFIEGRVGLFAQNVPTGSFSNVLYGVLPGRTPVSSSQTVFAAEETMQIWSGPLSDWTKVPHTPAVSGDSDSRSLEVWWHRADFHGDVRLDLCLQAPPAPGSEVGLILNGNGQNLSEGILARLRRNSPDEEDGDGGLKFNLLSGESGEESVLTPWGDGPCVLTLRRVGHTVTLSAGGRTLLSRDFSDPFEFDRVGWYVLDIPVTFDDVAIYSDTFINYAFNTAPTDWRSGGGTWEVTNKWDCDPRWSFFSGQSDKLAVLWNKRPLRGDFTIEYYVGNKRYRARGANYEYAQDMNVTVCADGKDLSSGYSFLFGGFDNTMTGICREATRWALPSGRTVLINRKGLHRKWYHVMVSRKGSQLEMRIDNTLVVSQIDEDPLKGGHWALWTRNNAIMVARVRVTAEEIGRCDSPDVAWPETTQTIYPDS